MTSKEKPGGQVGERKEAIAVTNAVRELMRFAEIAYRLSVRDWKAIGRTMPLRA